MARGIDNNNPGNIKKTGNWRAWQGLAPEDQQKDPTFIVFTSAVWGLRAMACTLITYYDKRLAPDGSKIDTLDEIIGRWAPAADSNNTSAYASDVEKQTGHGALDVLNMHTYADIRPLLEAIVRHENGQQPYSAAQFDQALTLAGVVKPIAPLLNKKVIGATVATASAVVQQTVAQVQPVWDGLNKAGFKLNIAWLLNAHVVYGAVSLAIVGGVGFAVYDIYRRHRAMVA